MPTNTGNAVGYVAGTGHIPVPLATDRVYRTAHKPQTAKPTGLDWSKHRAPDSEQTHATPAPVVDLPVEAIAWPCRGCSQRSTELVKELCPDCRFDAEAKFQASTGPVVVDIALTPPPPELTAAEQAIVDRFDNAHTPAELLTDIDMRTSDEVAKQEAPDLSGVLDQLLDQLATVRATVTTDLARIETALDAARLTLRTPVAAALAPEAPGRRCRSCGQTFALLVDDALCIRCDAALPTPVAGPTIEVPPASSGPVTGPSSSTTFETFDKPRRSVRRRSTSSQVDKTEVIRLYTEERRTIADIAATLHAGKQTVRNILLLADVELRDDRKTNSGGRNRQVYDPQLVADVRRLYLDEQRSRTEVAAEVGLTLKQVDTLMRRHQIPARQGQSGGGDTITPLRERIAALGVTSRDIKVWGLAHGLVPAIQRGIPSYALVDAYETAHPTGNTDSDTARPTNQEDQPA